MESHVLETKRLILRQPSLDDLDRWAEMMADPVSAHHVGGVQPKTVVWRIIMQMIGAWQVTGVSMFSVVEKESGRWIGRVGPWQPLDWPGTEIGWALHRDSWGKGYATEAARASINYAVDVLDWTEVIHCINPANTRSASVARRLGAAPRAQTKMPPPFDHETVDIWAQSATAWRQREKLP